MTPARSPSYGAASPEDDDTLSINFADPLAARLKELGSPLLYWRVQGGGHGAFHKPAKWGAWMPQALPWLREKGFAVPR